MATPAPLATSPPAPSPPAISPCNDTSLSMERGSLSRRPRADSSDEADSEDAALCSVGPRMPPLAAAAHAAQVLRSSSLNPNADPFSASPGGGFSSPILRSRSRLPTPRRLLVVARLLLGPVAGAAVDAAVCSRLVSWRRRVSRILVGRLLDTLAPWSGV